MRGLSLSCVHYLSGQSVITLTYTDPEVLDIQFEDGFPYII